jgi:hypothetical protein
VEVKTPPAGTTYERVPDLRHPRGHTGMQIATFIFSCVAIGGAVASYFINLGKNQAAIDSLKEMRDLQSHDHDDIQKTHYEAVGANTGVQELRGVVHDGFDRIERKLDRRH